MVSIESETAQTLDMIELKTTFASLKTGKTFSQLEMEQMLKPVCSIC